MLTSTGFEPTREQRAVIDACAAGSDLVIEAGAGTGKTSVLRMASAAMTGRRGVYLAFTRATADSARLSFGPDVECVTAHALAYRAVGWRYADRLRGQATRMPAWAAARQLGIREPLLLGRDLIITPAHQARIVLGTVERFCFSGDERIGGAHVPPVNGVDPASFAELTWRIVPWAERAWHDIRAVNGALPFRHDHYLKLWQLTPAFPVWWDSEIFDICNSGDDSWIRTSPQKHIAISSKINKRADGLVVPAVKMLKAWNRNAGRPLRSFHLEVLAWKVLDPGWRADWFGTAFGMGPDPENLARFFAEAPGRLRRKLPDPARDEGDLGGYLTDLAREDAISRLRTASSRCEQAAQLDAGGDAAGAIAAYRKVFGDVFPC